MTSNELKWYLFLDVSEKGKRFEIICSFGDEGLQYYDGITQLISEIKGIFDYYLRKYIF